MALVLAAICGLTGVLTEYGGHLGALGGPNGYLYDLTLKGAQSWRRDVKTAPAVFVAVDQASLAAPDLAALPRALWQPIWARLIEGVLKADARRVAFDVVFAYAGDDFRVGPYTLPEYDQTLTDTLRHNRDRVVIGRFPGTPPAPAFVEAIGNARIGVLDLEVESDGVARSTVPLVRLPNGRLALGFAALGAGLNLRQAGANERILITPNAPAADIPTYSLGTLLDCLNSPAEAERLREALAERIVVVGMAIPGEDEHRAPTQFMGYPRASLAAERCAPQRGLIQRSRPETVPGALLQLAAIQSASSDNPVTMAPTWLRFVAAALLALVFASVAFHDEIALTVGEQAISSGPDIVWQLTRSFVVGLVGPVLVGVLASTVALAAANSWLPMGYPILAAVLLFAVIVSVRSVHHRVAFRGLFQTAGRYLPPARLVELARAGFSDPPEGEEREVSILLVDLVGFTTFSNVPGRSAREVVRTANQYFSLMQTAIDRHGGCSDKFLGDAVLAFWNGLSDDPDHAVKALASAREIIDAVRDASSFEHRLSVRAVVCTGKVYVGDLGAKQRSNFTIIGPAVNETFRLERVPDIYGLPLAIAAATAQAIMAAPPEVLAAHGGEGVLVRIDEVELKGFSGSRSVYAHVPADDPGREAFEAGRNAIDQGRIQEGLAHLGKVRSGVLQTAAKIVSERYRSAA